MWADGADWGTGAHTCPSSADSVPTGRAAGSARRWHPLVIWVLIAIAVVVVAVLVIVLRRPRQEPGVASFRRHIDALSPERAAK